MNVYDIHIVDELDRRMKQQKNIDLRRLKISLNIDENVDLLEEIDGRN
jgi:hypothetical protein